MLKINSWLLILSAARGLFTRFTLVCPTKVKAGKSFVFIQKFLIVENKEHLFIVINFKLGAHVTKLWVFGKGRWGKKNLHKKSCY